ncbi:MAG: ParB N-terminal domain-containing protein [Planctomycetes bacterium]|nr:ParB N-terminal domain-containing protein [Planctomycetota bacterium]
MTLKNRIKGLQYIRAGDLRPNPRNWRTHSAPQQAALQAVLEEVGIAGVLIARETADGFELIDGHLRADGDPDQEWPVLVLDVDEAEADKLLATLDPLAAMAGADAERLDELLHSIETDGTDPLEQHTIEQPSKLAL